MKHSMIVFLILISAAIILAEKNGNNGKTELTRSVPNMIDYQGRITDGSNDPITTPVSIAFAIYDNSVDGTQLWSETHTSVTPVEGLVHVLLGSESAFAWDLFDGSERWLGITVGSDDEMTPRLRIVSSPYAITSNTVKGNNLFVDDSGSVGIGTTTPNTNTKLNVNEGTILFDGTTGSTPVSGAGTRFMWIPSKYAIRAGSITGTQWDDANIGLYSAAFGLNNTTSGAYSFAAGSGNSITGVASSAFGLSNNVTRPYSYAFGNNSSATGSYSFAFGRYAEAQANHEIALGRFNVVSGTWGTWIDSEPLFILGNGADDLNRSNALTIFKDGRTTIGSDTRGEMLTVEGTIESTSGGIKFPDGTTQTTAAGAGVNEINDLTDAKTDVSSIFLGSGAGTNDDGTFNYNVGVGINALHINTTGSFNTANGYLALYTNSSGLSNTATGSQALYANTGSFNTANGHRALENNTTGQCNTAVGSDALATNTGSYNTGLGYSALFENTTGQYNVGLGYCVNYNNQEGSQNTIIGFDAGKGSFLHSKSGNIFLGFQSGYNELGDNKLYIENSDSSTPLIYGEFANDKIVINGEFQATGITRDSGGDAGTNGQILASTSSGTDWVDPASEINDLADGKTGGNSVFLGTSAGTNDDGTDNYNVAVGYQSLYENTSGQDNVGVGYGVNYYNQGGSENTIIGSRAGMGIMSHGKSGNVFIGFNAGYLETGDNKLYIENSSSVSPLIYGDFATDKVTINDVLILTPRSTVPIGPVNGEIYVGTDNHIYCYLGGAWKQLDN